MSQFPHDKLNKNLADLCLGQFGEFQPQRPVQGETKFIDIYFTPQRPIPESAQLGLLGQCVGVKQSYPGGNRPVALEPYRNPVDVDKIRACLIKILEVQQELDQAAQQSGGDPHQAFMWIITPTLAQHNLDKCHAVGDEETWGSGVYILPSFLQMGIIVVHQLPVTPETLWFRLMGKGKVQQTAIAEVAALPLDHPYRSNALDLLLSYKVELEAKQSTEPEEQELIMQLSPLLLERIAAAEQVGEQRGEQRGQQIGEQLGALKGRQEIVLRQLTRVVGFVSEDLVDRVKFLSLGQVDDLADALLDFGQVSDLLDWLGANE
jgi:Domain of unknown function (DUF4351)